jgi:prepilin-type N-terminal cleavage/methylation domain-containing protein
MKRKGFTLVELLVVIAIIALLMGILMPALARVRQTAFRMVCGTNLSGIGKAMLIYANDYEDELPRAGGRTTTWGGPVDFDAMTRRQAYGLTANGSAGKGTITSCFYLLVKYAEVTPKSFLCKGDSGVSEFKPAEYGVGDRDLIGLWDFGDSRPTQHCSYSLHLPFDRYALTTSSDPGMAVAGDRNPWMAGPFGDKIDKISLFSWADRDQMKHGNAVQHQDEGQNVLFLDSHVSFEKSPLCGINEDNVWTYWDGGDIRIGLAPSMGQVINAAGNRRADSLLVNDGQGAGSPASGPGPTPVRGYG